MQTGELTEAVRNRSVYRPLHLNTAGGKISHSVWDFPRAKLSDLIISTTGPLPGYKDMPWRQVTAAANSLAAKGAKGCLLCLQGSLPESMEEAVLQEHVRQFEAEAEANEMRFCEANLQVSGQVAEPQYFVTVIGVPMEQFDCANLLSGNPGQTTEETCCKAESEKTTKPAEKTAKSEKTTKPAEKTAKSEKTTKPAEKTAESERTTKPAEKSEKGECSRSKEDAVNMDLVQSRESVESMRRDLVLQPGQELVVVRSIALAGTAALARMYEEKLRGHFPHWLIDRAKEFDRWMSVTEAARAVCHFGACPMHCLAQGGIFNALWEMAEAAGVGLEVDLRKIPVRQETIEICEYFDVNPYYLYSAGTLLIGTGQAEALIAVLRDADIPAVVIGRTTDKNDRIIQNGDNRRFLDRPKQDELWRLSCVEV